MNNSPMVAVVIPCYNQGEFLIDSIQSVINQKYTNWECIVVDDGSIKDISKIVNAFIEKDTRIKFFKQENGGLSSARNHGISKTKCKYILPLDADDKINSGYLKKAVSVLESNQKVKVVYGLAEYFGNKEGEWVLPIFTLESLARRNVIYCSGVFRKTDWELVNGYDESMKFGLEDWEFWINILKNGGNVHRINEVCFYYRVRNNSMIRSLGIEQKKHTWNYISKKHIDFFIKHIGSFPELVIKMNKQKRDNDTLKYSKKNALKVIFNTLTFKNKKR